MDSGFGPSGMLKISMLGSGVPFNFELFFVHLHTLPRFGFVLPQSYLVAQLGARTCATSDARQSSVQLGSAHNLGSFAYLKRPSCIVGL